MKKFIKFKIMRTLGTILRSFFKTKKLQYWLCIPSSFKTKHEKEMFIMDTIMLLQSKIEVNEIQK